MTCLTGVGPADHGIRDFITKAQDSYLPTIGLFEVHSVGGIPRYTSCRTAPTLGEILRKANKTTYMLKVPGTFPPPHVQGGLLGGFGTPDLLGTFGVSAWYTSDPEQKRAAAPEGKELVQPLVAAGQRSWRGEMAGPAQSRLAFVARDTGDGVALSIGHAAGPPAALLKQGAWSGWVRSSFELPLARCVPGICRFKLVSLGTEIELYRTPLQCVPGASLYPLAEPSGFAERLARLVGPYATIGMPADLDGVRRGVVDLDTFLQDAYANWEQQVEMTLRLMAEPDWDLLFTHLFTADNVQHLFWHCADPRHPAHTIEGADRYGDEIERAYRWLDRQLGRLLAAVDPDTTVFVVSDHGGTPIYRLLYLNAWLRSQGYLFPREQPEPGAAARLDWNRTRAAMFGTGGVWINVRGRDPRGIVPPGPAYEALRREIAAKLRAWQDPETGEHVVAEVFWGEDVFGAASRQRGPDLVPALTPGYGLGRGEGLGRVMLDKRLIEPNVSHWSGGHEGPYLASAMPGLCVLRGPRVPSNSALGEASLQDIAPTILELLQVDGGAAMAGRSLV
jgi:predicted AlkP superfamily phosphohydrolase/phosphomutase